jgi:hypothetical protein
MCSIVEPHRLDESFTTPEEAAEWLELGLFLFSPDEDWRRHSE